MLGLLSVLALYSVGVGSICHVLHIYLGLWYTYGMRILLIVFACWDSYIYIMLYKCGTKGISLGMIESESEFDELNAGFQVLQVF